MAQPANGIRRPNGTGNVRQRGSGQWDARIRLVTGQRYIGSFDTEEEAEAALEAYRNEPVLRVGNTVMIVREEIAPDGTVFYGIRDAMGNIWKFNLELWT